MQWTQDANGKWWWQGTDPNTGKGYTEGPYENQNFDQPLPSRQRWWEQPNGAWASAEHPDQQYNSPGGTAFQGQPAAAPAAQPAPSAPAAAPQTVPPPGVAPAATDTTTADNDAQAAINSYLAPFGLESLGSQMFQQYKNGVPMEQIQLNIRNSDEYKARFPGMADLITKGHAINESQYIDLERSYTSLLRQAGLPATFYDTPDDFGKLIAGEVSPTEFGKRLDMYSNLVYTADPSAKAFLKEYYGVDDAGVLAYAIDPTKALPILQKQFLAAQESAAAVRSGFGGLSKDEAEQVANWGIDPQQAAGKFTQLGMDRQLFQPLPGEADYAGINRTTAIAGYLGGNADAIQQVERERAARVGAFAGGGQYAMSSKGVGGLATPQQ